MAAKSVLPLSTALELVEDQVQITLAFGSEDEAEAVFEILAEAIKANRLAINAGLPSAIEETEATQ